MQNQQSTTEILNDLIKINNDRIEGYRKATDEAGAISIDLKAIFANFINDSEEYKNALQGLVNSYGGNAEQDATTVSGKLYRAWMDVKATFTGSDRTGILSACEYGEDAAQKAYKQALENSAELMPDALQLITEQKESLKKAHDIIKKYRDVHEAVNK